MDKFMVLDEDEILKALNEDIDKIKNVSKFCIEHNISNVNIKDYFQFVDEARELIRKGWLKLNE